MKLKLIYPELNNKQLSIFSEVKYHYCEAFEQYVCYVQ